MNARNLADFSVKPDVDASRLDALGVSVSVGEKILLHPLTAHFIAGEVTAILGPNGAGKSTLMSVLTGQRQPDQGQVLTSGRPLKDCSLADLARTRAFVAQETQVAFGFSVREVVELGRYPHRRQPGKDEAGIVSLAMRATGVDDLADRPLNTLSGGEKARAHLARALAQIWTPVEGWVRWLILDEPTAALDLQHQHRMLQLAREWATRQGVGVIAVLHDLNLALRYSDRCLVLQQGRVFVSGVTSEVLTPECIQAVWNVRAHPVELAGQRGVQQFVFEVG